MKTKEFLSLSKHDALDYCNTIIFSISGCSVIILKRDDNPQNKRYERNSNLLRKKILKEFKLELSELSLPDYVTERDLEASLTQALAEREVQDIIVKTSQEYQIPVKYDANEDFASYYGFDSLDVATILHDTSETLRDMPAEEEIKVINAGTPQAIIDFICERK